MNVNSLRNVINHFVCEQKYAPSKINNFLENLEFLIIDLSNKTNCKNNKEILNYIYFELESLKTHNKQHIDSLFSGIEINLLENSKGLKQTFEKLKSQQLDWIAKARILQIIFEKCSEKSKTLEKYFSNGVLSNDKLNQLKENLSSEILEDFFTEIFNKCEKLKAQIELQQKDDLDKKITKSFISRISHLISPEQISVEINNSRSKDPRRGGKYETLKFNWTQSYIAFKSLEAFIDKELISSKIIPSLSDFSEKVARLNKYFSSLNLYLKDLNFFSLDSKQDLYPFLVKIKSYSEHKNFLEGKMKSLNEFETSKIDLIQKVGESSKEISTTIETIKNHKHFPKIVEQIPYETNGEKNVMFNSMMSNSSMVFKIVEDDSLVKNGDEEKNHASIPGLLTHTIKELELLDKEIANKWIDFSSEIEKIKTQKDIYFIFNNITENLGLCYFLAQSIYENIKTVSTTENDKSAHISRLKENIEDFKRLYNLISDIDPYEVETKDISNEQFRNLQKILKKELNFTLRIDYPRIINLPESIFSSCLHEVIYSSENNGIEEFTKRKQDLRLVWNKLREICQLIVDEIKRGRKAVDDYGNDSSYNNCFTQAYSSSTPSIEYVQSWGTSFKNGLSYGGSLIGLVNSQEPPQEEKVSIDEVISPFENLTFLNL